MTDRRIAIASFLVALFALVVSAAAFMQSRAQYLADYEQEVTVTANEWPINPISSVKPSQVSIEVRNTSKRNLEYVLRLTGNAICTSEREKSEVFLPCQYESRAVRISKPEAGAHFQVHKLFVRALPGAVKINPLAYVSDPNYFVTLEVVNAANGTTLHKTTCYYAYAVETGSLSLYKPIIDTSGKSKTLQASCM